MESEENHEIGSFPISVTENKQSKLANLYHHFKQLPVVFHRGVFWDLCYFSFILMIFTLPLLK